MKGSRNKEQENSKRASTSKDEDGLEVKSSGQQMYVNHFRNYTIMQAENEDKQSAWAKNLSRKTK